MQQLQVSVDGGEDVEEYRRLLTREPDSLRFAEYADRLRRVGKLEDARTVCRRGLERHPAYPTGHVIMGDILSDLGNPAEAEAEWRQALRLDPGHPLAHVRLGDLYLSRGERDRAILAFEAALIYSPGLSEARERLAEIRGPEATSRSGGTVESGEPPRTPGERPTWLSADRFQALLERLAASSAMDEAAIVDNEGAVLAGTESVRQIRSVSPAAVSFAARAKALLLRLGAGRLRSALALGEEVGVRIVPLGDITLLCAVRHESRVAEADTEIEEALAVGARDDAGERLDESKCAGK